MAVIPDRLVVLYSTHRTDFPGREQGGGKKLHGTPAGIYVSKLLICRGSINATTAPESHVQQERRHHGFSEGAITSGAEDDSQGAVRAPCPACYGYERQRSALPAGPVPQWVSAGGDRSAPRNRRYGAGMIYPKLHPRGLVGDHKLVERLYTEACLHVYRRKRKNVPPGERQALVRPDVATDIWSMEFVFHRCTGARVVKCLTIINDAMHESVANMPELAIGELAKTRILDDLAISRGLPEIIRTGNGKEFCGHALLTWAHTRQVKLTLIEPGKLNRNAVCQRHGGATDLRANNQYSRGRTRLPEVTSRHQGTLWIDIYLVMENSYSYHPAHQTWT